MLLPIGRYLYAQHRENWGLNSEQYSDSEDECQRILYGVDGGHKAKSPSMCRVRRADVRSKRCSGYVEEVGDAVRDRLRRVCDEASYAARIGLVAR
jgi:hypothetical protein